MSLKADAVLNSSTEAPSHSSSNAQQPRVVEHKIANDESIEQILMGTEEVQPSPTYIQGWRLHLLTLGYQHIQSWAIRL